MKELKSGDYNATYKSLKILKIREIIKLEKRKFGFKYIKQLLPQKIIEIVNDDQFKRPLIKQHNYRTRNKKLPNKPKARTSAYQKSFLCTWSDEYYPLPIAIKDSIHIRQFTKKCKELIFA